MCNNESHPVLIVDGLNVFMRAYCAYPTMNTDGEQIGGVAGFIKMLIKVVNDIQPKSVYIAWESGGSNKRRSLYSEYKLNRKPEKLNRFYEDDIPETDENRSNQIKILLSVLKNLPVCQVYVANCEGDDIVAYLCKISFKNETKVIMSSDKDMYQLLDDQTSIYNLHKKIYLTNKDILEEFKIETHNFALAKCICGDQSDNIPGVKGIGFKTIAKYFPQLATNTTLILQDIFNYSNAHLGENKIFSKVLENEDVIKRNWKLVYLDGTMLSSNQCDQVNHVVETYEPTIDKMNLIKIFNAHGITNLNSNDICYSFNCIQNIKYISKFKE